MMKLCVGVDCIQVGDEVADDLGIVSFDLAGGFDAFSVLTSHGEIEFEFVVGEVTAFGALEEFGQLGICAEGVEGSG